MNHPPQPPADITGWTSGACITTEPVEARDILVGDRLFYDGIVVTVEATRSSSYWLDLELVDGVAIDWKAANRMGRMFCRETDIVERVQRGS
jgi:hypothetical protein